MSTPSRHRKYYSVRTGRSPDAAHLSLESLKGLFLSAYKQWDEAGYHTESFGFWCVDMDWVAGTVGIDIPNYVLFELRRGGLWPVAESIEHYEEHDLFDVIEFLHDHVSKPTEGNFHSYGGCGMHWTEFDRREGQAEYRTKLNPLLENYGVGFELNEKGEIMELAPSGLSRLLDAKLPTQEPSISEKVQGAIDRFRRYGSSRDDRQKAVRDLADVLERLRPNIKTALLSKDENDLFELANRFGIRHYNANQKTDYDPAVWLSWMFYYYLATINACLHLLDRQKREAA